MSAKRKQSRRKPRSRAWAVKLLVALIAFVALWATAAVWYVHHPRKWLDRHDRDWPRVVTGPLLWLGNPLGDITDAFGWTGHDAVYEYDEEAPSGAVTFAGAPRRVGSPAPDDIVILDRGEFLVGWSPKLRHPVWCAYHVPPESRFEPGKRPNFVRDRNAPGSPPAASYTGTHYDRGHMVPNFAIATRFGDEEQRKTFQMSNVAPQSPSLNRGVWRQLEHRIAELWTARWGEIWVVVGAISTGRETLSGTDIDVPTAYYQVVIAQEGLDIRAFATLFDQEVPWSAWPTRHLITIEELEKLSGLDFFPDLPEFIQNPLEAELPSRLWPIRARDIFRQISIRFPES